MSATLPVSRRFFRVFLPALFLVAPTEGLISPLHTRPSRGKTCRSPIAGISKIPVVPAQQKSPLCATPPFVDISVAEGSIVSCAPSDNFQVSSADVPSRPRANTRDAQRGTRRKSRKSPLAILSLAALLVLGPGAGPASASTAIPRSAGGAVSALERFFVTMPYTSSFAACGLQAAAADCIAQLRKPGAKGRIEKARIAGFAIYGSCYVGVSQYYIYNRIFPVVFGRGTELPVALAKSAADAFVLSPLLSLPLAYVIKALSAMKSPKEGMRRYIRDVKDGLLFKSWALWLPFHVINFSLVPEHLRIPLTSSVAFFWMIILSFIASGGDAGDTAKAI